MVTAPPRTMTAEDFEAYAESPENAEKLLEFIAGEVYEVPSNPFSSAISSLLIYLFISFIREQNIQAHVTGEAGGYQVMGERYAPDVAVLLKSKQLELAQQGYNPLPPDLAVEVDFPSTQESRRNLLVKLANYLAAGTVVWIIYPNANEVEVYAPGQPARILNINDTLDAGDVLPGFTLAVKHIFGP